MLKEVVAMKKIQTILEMTLTLALDVMKIEKTRQQNVKNCASKHLGVNFLHGNKVPKNVGRKQKVALAMELKRKALFLVLEFANASPRILNGVVDINGCHMAMVLDTKKTGKPVGPSVQTTKIAICGPLTPISRHPTLEGLSVMLKDVMAGAGISLNEESPRQPSVIE